MEKYENYIQDMANSLKKEYEALIENKSKNLDNRIYRKICTPMASACEDEVARLVSKVLNKKYMYLIDVYLKREKEQEKAQKGYRPDIIIIEPNDKGIKIVGIIEVKSQMGYCPVYKPSDFKDKIEKLKKKDCKISFSKEEMTVIMNKKNKKLREFMKKCNLPIEDLNPYDPQKDAIAKYKKQLLEYTIDFKDLKIFVVNIIASNHESKVEETILNFEKNKSLKNIKFYTLFGNNEEADAWYNNLSINNIYEKSEKNKESKVNENMRKKHGFMQFLKDLQDSFK